MSEWGGELGAWRERCGGCGSHLRVCACARARVCVCGRARLRDTFSRVFPRARPAGIVRAMIVHAQPEAMRGWHHGVLCAQWVAVPPSAPVVGERGPRPARTAIGCSGGCACRPGPRLAQRGWRSGAIRSGRLCVQPRHGRAGPGSRPRSLGTVLGRRSSAVFSRRMRAVDGCARRRSDGCMCSRSLGTVLG